MDQSYVAGMLCDTKTNVGGGTAGDYTYVKSSHVI